MEAALSPPLYREGYPFFDVVKAEAECIRGRDVCTFKRGRGAIGFCTVAGCEAESVTLLCEFSWKHHRHPRGEVVLPMRRHQRGIHQQRPVLLCPSCQAEKTKLFFKTPSWACGECHGLLFRSQLLDPRVKAWERFDELSSQIAEGRPRRMRHHTFAQLKKERADLKKRLRGLQRAEASREHSLIIEALWRTREETAQDLLLWDI